MQLNQQHGQTDNFNAQVFTFAQVQACLEHTDPSGMTWMEFCLKNGWGIEDMLRPLTVLNGYQVEENNNPRVRQQERDTRTILAL